MSASKKTIGVLALQGGVAEHVHMIEAVGAKAVLVKLPAHLEQLDGIILPGGESTAIGKMLHKNALFEPLKEKIKHGLPTWGTCAGAILLSHSGSEFSMDTAPFKVARNAYGSQLDSFETIGKITGIADDFPFVFIRAPKFVFDPSACKVLATIRDEAVFLEYNNIWASAFHPELSDDTRVHAAFVERC